MYRNFSLTDTERKQIMEMHQSHGYKAPINEMFGATWLTKIKIDSPQKLTDEQKHEMADKFQRGWNGLLAVEFEPGEWFNQDGKIENIEEYENYVNTEIYGKDREKPGNAEFEATIKKHHRNTEPDSPHQYQYGSYDDYKTRGLTDLTPTERKEKEDAFNRMKETGFSFGVHEAKQKLKESFNRFAINEIEKYTPSIDSPEDEDVLSAEYGFDEPYDPYQEDPFKSIESDDFYDEKIGELRAKEAPRRKRVDTSVTYRGPHADGRMNKFGFREAELDQKITVFQDMMQKVEMQMDPLVDEYEQRRAAGERWLGSLEYEIRKLQDEYLRMQGRVEKYTEMKNNFQPLRPSEYKKRDNMGQFPEDGEELNEGQKKLKATFNRFIINEQTLTDNQRLAVQKGYGPVSAQYADQLGKEGKLLATAPNNQPAQNSSAAPAGTAAPASNAQAAEQPKEDPTLVNCAASLGEIKAGSNKILKHGCKTEAVKELQKMLGMEAKYHTGMFGRITKAKVIEFQKDPNNKDAEGKALLPDGRVGDKTYGALVKAKTAATTTTDPATTVDPTKATTTTDPATTVAATDSTAVKK